MLINTVTPKDLSWWRLHAEYQDVEYIRWSSWWWQYIDTWMANISTATKVEYSYIPYTNNEWIIFMDNTWNSEWFGNGWNYYYYKNYPGTNMPSNSVWTKVTIVLANDWCSKNWSNIRVPNKSSLSTTWTILLMANRRWGSIDGTAGRDCALYYYKRWENWTLVQDFVPCYRKSDSVIWMYDIVNKVFYTNSWSWTFTKWPDVD